MLLQMQGNNGMPDCRSGLCDSKLKNQIITNNEGFPYRLLPLETNQNENNADLLV
jgi:hypothetical protein